jgi:L-gulonate 5-dehydrogenase
MSRYNCCAELRFLSLHVDGALAEYVALPANRVHELPDELPSPVAVLCEPFAVGMQAVERARVDGRDRIVVMGAGLIGLSVLLIARSRGARVLVAEVSDARRRWATQLGAEAVSSGDLNELRRAVLEFTDGEGASVVVDATGVPSMIAASTTLARPAGRVAIVGFTAKPVQLSALEVVSKELDVLGVRNCTDLFPLAVQFVAAHAATVARLIHRVYPFSQIAEAYRFADEQGTQILRIAVSISG